MSSEHVSQLKDLITILLKEDASDLHLSEGRQPIIRVAGFLVPLVKIPALSRADVKGILDEILDAKKKSEFLERMEVDFSYDHDTDARFRCNAFFQLGRISIAMRLIPKKIKTLEIPTMVRVMKPVEATRPQPILTPMLRN